MTCEGRTRKPFLRLQSYIARRQLLLGVAAMSAALGRRAAAETAQDNDPNEDLRNLRLQDLTEGGRRFTLITPRYLNPDQRLPLLVLLHGLGETTNEKLGAYAWIDKYGLGSAWQRMKRAPVERVGKRGEWTDARLAEVNAELAARPFRGFAMACPYMPNPSGAADLDAYAKWLETSLVPRARREVRTIEDPAHTYLCGVSLGGYVSLEMLTRLSGLFGAWGGVQTAIGTFAAARYAEKIASAGGPARPLLLLTSTQDHWRASSEALDAAFTAQKLPHTFRVIPGPHDQLWLREAGTLEALLWFDRLSYAKT
jgi:predicted esterase